MGINDSNANNLALLSLLNNPEAVKEQIESIEEASRQAQEVLDLVGPAQEILQMREQIGAQMEELRAKALETDKDCEDLVAYAEEQAAKIVAEAESAAAGAAAEAEEARNLADEARASAYALQSELDGRVVAVQEREEAHSQSAGVLQQKAEDLSRRELELEGEKNRLAELGEHIRTTLG